MYIKFKITHKFSLAEIRDTEKRIHNWMYTLQLFHVELLFHFLHHLSPHTTLSLSTYLKRFLNLEKEENWNSRLILNL